MLLPISKTIMGYCVFIAFVEFFCLLEGVLSIYLDEVTPRRVDIAIGGSANITCTMNTLYDGSDSSTLYFVAHDSGAIVPSSEIYIVNKTSVVYMLRDAVEQDHDIICKSGQFAIGQAHVSVGTPPLDVQDFKCRGFDYMYFSCNFTKPSNTILTQYNITYTVFNALPREYWKLSRYENGTRFYRTIYSQPYRQTCDLQMIGDQYICNLTETTYRINHELYNFTVTGNNELGTNRQVFLINHYESVIPSQPNMQLNNITIENATLIWRLSSQYHRYEKKGLELEVLIRPDGFDWYRGSKGGQYTFKQKQAEFQLELKMLPYPYFWYTIRVRMRVKRTPTVDSAISTEMPNMWGEYGELRIQTLSTRPGRPPRTDVGSFYVGSSEPNVRLYWEQLEEYEKNGPDFSYVITRVKRNNTVVNLEPLYIDRISATFAWDSGTTYEFIIRSQNAEGKSLKGNRILVPAQISDVRHRELAPKWIRNVYHANNRTYTLSWTSPEQMTQLIDYTVFWCPSKRANSNECQGSVRFMHLSRFNTSWSIAALEQEHTLNFAVSANYPLANMGMQWTMCAVDGSSDLVKMEPEFSTPIGGAILVQWSTDRVCTSLTEGYNITYCEMSALQTYRECLYPEVTLTIEKTAKKFIVQHLRPFTIYKLQMYMYSKLRVGQLSDAQYITTLEEAPTQPRDLRVYNVSNHSAWIKWLPPEQMNGRLKYYTIYLIANGNTSNQQYTVNCVGGDGIDQAARLCGTNDSNEMISYELKKLHSFTEYTAEIRAHTVANSFPSNSITFRTLIGKPSNPQHISESRNTSPHNENLIQWLPPAEPAGRLDFYEVKVTVWQGNFITNEFISVVMDAEACSVFIPPCANADDRVTLSVRAINVAAHDDTETDVHLKYGQQHMDKEVEEEEKHITASHMKHEDDGDNNSGLHCIARVNIMKQKEQKERLRLFFDNEKYTLFRSSWENGPTHHCGMPIALSMLWVKILFPIIFASLVSVAVLAIWRKYRRMSKIECQLPSSLTQPMYGHDNAYLRLSDEDALSREKHRLLASLSSRIDSNTMPINGDGTTTTNGKINTEPSFYLATTIMPKTGSDITRLSLSASSGYAGSTHSNNSGSPTTPMPVISSALTSTSTLPSTLTTSYVPSDSYTVMSGGKSSMPQPPPTKNRPDPFHDGYVPPQSSIKLSSPPPTTIKDTFVDGYTTIGAFGQVKFADNNGCPMPEDFCIVPLSGGYVKPRSTPSLQRLSLESQQCNNT